jgi:hypothetical protein
MEMLLVNAALLTLGIVAGGYIGTNVGYHKGYLEGLNLGERLKRIAEGKHK